MTMRLRARGIAISAASASGKSTKPSAYNTGVNPAKVSLTDWAGSNYLTDSNVTYTRQRFRNFVNILGKNVTINQCYFDAGVQFTTADGLLVQDSSTKAGVSISSVNGATFRRFDVDGTSGDMMHVTGDQANNTIPCRNIVIEDSFLHGPVPADGDHADGIQIRGCLGFSLIRSVIDMGPWLLPPNGADAFNAAFFLQNANGGNANVAVTDCWINGGGHSFQCDAVVSGSFSITGTQIGKDFHYGIYTGTAQGAASPTQSNNRYEGTTQAVLFP